MSKIKSEKKECLEELIRNTPGALNKHMARIAILSPSLEQLGVIAYSSRETCGLISEGKLCLRDEKCKDCKDVKHEIVISSHEMFDFQRDGFSVYYWPDSRRYVLYQGRNIVMESDCPIDVDNDIDYHNIYWNYLKLTFVR